MTNPLKIAADLALPLTAVTEKFAWLGRTGSGKTYGAMKLAEQMLTAGATIGAIDPVGVWKGLRVPATKGGRSFDVVVFGGLVGYDLPLEPTAGAIVADLVVDRALSFVLDVSQMIQSEQQRFIHDFADRFFQRRKSSPAAVHLFMEECQEYIPENPSGAEARTLGVMQRMWKLGRNFGIGGSLISQRPQEIAKKALNMSGTLFAFQMTGPQERRTIKAWVADQGVVVNIEAALQMLRIGHAHVESPVFLGRSGQVHIDPRETADLSSTPKVSGGAVAARPLTPIDVEQLKAAMAATIEKAKADDPKELRRQIADLRQQVAKAGAQANPKTAAVRQPAVVEKPVLTDVQLRQVQEMLDRFDRAVGRAADMLAKPAGALREALAGLTAAVRSVQQPALPLKQPRTSFEHGAFRRGSYVIPKTRETVESDARPEPVRRILQSLGWWAAMGIDMPTRTQVAFIARYTVNGHFNNTLGAMVTEGLITYPVPGTVGLTPTGAAEAPAPADVPSFEAMVEAVRQVIRDEPLQRVFTAMLRCLPAVDREALAAACEPAYTVNGHFNNTLGTLRSMGVLAYPTKGMVGLGPMFAPFLRGNR